ncbi:hypothetical protein Tco_0591673 [Tanacetum coccineum]
MNMTRADSNNTGGSGSTNTGWDCCAEDFGTRLYANHDHWEQVKAMKRSGNTASNEIERWSKRSDSDSERR